MPRPKLPHPPSTVHPKVRKAAKKYGELGNANKLKGLDQEKVFESLKPYLQLGYSLKKSCLLVGVAYTTVHGWCRENPSTRILLYSYQNQASVKARSNIVKKIQEGSVENSWQWLKARDADFNTPVITKELGENEFDDHHEDGVETEDAAEELESLLKENGLI